MVRVETTDGKSFTGVLMALEPDVVVVQPRTRLPKPARRIPLDIIVSLAPESKDLDVGKALTIGIGAGAASFVALFLIVWAAILRLTGSPAIDAAAPQFGVTMPTGSR